MRFSSKPKPLHRFPDPSFAVTRLLRAGEYIPERPDDMAPGHIGPAVKDYAHFSAPKRCYTNLITQRLLEAAFASS
jgi:exoribonuclease R